MAEKNAESVKWQILDESQSSDVLRLVLAIEEADGAPYRSDLGEVEDFFSPVWISRVLGGRAPSGELVAFGLVRLPANHGEIAEATLWGGIHPEWRYLGLGRELVGMQVRAAREIALENGVREASLVMHVDEGHDDLTDLLVRDGFATKQSYVQMRRSLKEPIVVPDASAFISLVPLTEEYDGQVRAAHNAIHLENMGGNALSAQQWEAERAYMERTWSFAALDTLGDRPRLAGYIISGRYEQDWEARGWSEGYIDEIAIYDEARRNRLLKALLGKAMEAYQRDGIDYAGIDIPVQVGAEEPDVDFFMSLGFEITGRTFIYSKDIDMTSSPVRKVVQAQGRRRIFRATNR